MHKFLKQVYSVHVNSVSYYYRLLDQCLSAKSLSFLKNVHAQLIKVGFNGYTYSGNRYLNLYCQVGTIDDALKAFDEIAIKNCVSWNICLKGLLRFGRLEKASHLFDEIPVRDVVSWNSMISGYASYGFIGNALGVFWKMQNVGVRPSEYTFSILISLLSCPLHGKQIHGSMIRTGVDLSNVVLGNSLIDMYGKLSLADYAFGVFLSMEKLDIISWNSLILACHRSGSAQLALDLFCLLRTSEFSPDHYTLSTVISICCYMRDLQKGKQILALSIKMGFYSNSIVLSAIIDLLSKCNQFEAAIHIFKKVDQLDSAICNSMISSYVGHGFRDEAIELFRFMIRENFMLTEFTISSVLSSLSGFSPLEQSCLIHALVVKVGVESDAIVASSLMQVYSEVGSMDDAVKIFANLSKKDLVSWNTLIIGLARNGLIFETLNSFEDLLREGPVPDHVTMAGVLLACNHGRLVDRGIEILSSMEKKFGIMPSVDHYGCIVDLLSHVGKLKEALDIIDDMPYEPNAAIWRSVLHGSAIHGVGLNLIESVAEKIMELEPETSVPYLVLARAYEMRGRWESVVRVRKAMKQKCTKQMTACSWIGIKNHVFALEADQLLYHGREDIHLVLRLISWETKIEGYL